MAELQYIGARYVPKFFEGVNGSEWIANTQYEALTIVTRNGNSYTSKIPVPASIGAPENNPTYWVSTGLYNTQIEQYRQEVLNYRDDVDELDAKYDKLNFYADRKILIIGDSLSDTSLAEYQPNWVTYFKTRVEELGGTVVNHSLSGRSYSAVRGQNLVNSLDTVPDPTTYTDIIIFLGVNDWVSDATIQQISTASNIFEEWHNETNPSAHVHLITPCRCTTTWNPDFPLSYIRCALVNYGAKHYRWQIIDAYSEAPNMDAMRDSLRSLWTVDGLHFNAAYAPQFADYVFERVASKTSNFIPIGAEAISVDSAIANVNIQLYYYDDGDVRLYMELPEDYTPSSLTTVIGTLPLFARPYRTITHAFYYASGGVSKVAMLRIDPNGTLYMIPEALHAMRLGYINVKYTSSPVFGNVD